MPPSTATLPSCYRSAPYVIQLMAKRFKISKKKVAKLGTHQVRALLMHTGSLAWVIKSYDKDYTCYACRIR